MPRRTRRRSRSSDTGVQFIQILGLILILVMIMLFRDEIGTSAGAFFDAFDSPDVQLPEEGTAADAGPVDAR